MSRVAVASIAFTAALLNFLPLPAQTALTIHGHPQKASYASQAEWPFVSGQGHWTPGNPMGGTAHTHVECTAPLYAELPRSSTLTLACRLQLFHVAGHLDKVFGPLVSQVIWDTPGPMVGDPNGVVLRNITVTFDPALSDPSNPPQSVPQTGWYINTLVARTRFENGASTDVELFLPFYAVTPNVPEELGRHMRLGVHSCTQSGNSATVQSGHGCPLSQYLDDYVPIAPITALWSVPGHTSAYQIIEQFPGSGQFQQVNNADLHNGIAGTLVQDITDPDPRHEIVSNVVFDPATMNPGANKVALIWNQCTGAGNASFAAGECASALLVLTVNKGSGGGPGPTPVDCAGMKSWLEFSPGQWHQVFTVTQQPSNGGKACAVVVNGG